MTISEWLKTASKKIDRLDAELLLQHFLKAEDRSYLVAHRDEELPDTTTLDKKVTRRADGEPLAYILGYREFYHRKFIVTPDVLIPRPETEEIINQAYYLKPERIVDVGTGSGCIAITLALELAEQFKRSGCIITPLNTTIDAIDISDKALRVAQENAEMHSAIGIRFHKSDLLSDFTPKPGSLIIANLPYVDKNWDWLDHKTLDYEPDLALYAEKGGLALIYKLIDQIPATCSLMLEADPCQHDAIVKYAEKRGLKLKKRVKFILYLVK